MLLFYKIQTKIGVIANRIFILFKHFKKDKNNTLTHVTYYAVGNAGDTALSECVRMVFHKKYKPTSWKLLNISKKVNLNTIRQINSTNGLIIGGGGLFLPDTNKNKISGWQWAIDSDLLNRIKVPIIIFSVGYNYFRGQTADSLFVDNLNKLIRKSRFIGLRNSGSVKAIKELCDPDLRDKIIYQPCTTTLIRKIYPNLPKKKKRKNVCFNFAFDRSQMRFGSDEEKILSQILKSIKIIRNKGYKIFIIAHCPKDMSILKYLNDKNKVNIVNASYWSFGKLVRFYNQIDVVIGMRGHAQMIPFGCNCHIISLGSHEKMKWFLQDIDALDWYIELTENTDKLAQTIVKKFEIIHELNGDLTDKRLLEAQEKLYQITCKNMKTIKKILEASEK